VISSRQVLTELLRTLADAQTAWDARSGSGGVLLMPSPYHEGSYAELERRLAAMRDHPRQRTYWWHLSHRYRWGITHREHLPYRSTRQGPRPRLRPCTELVSAGPTQGKHMACIVYEWRPEVQPLLVETGIDLLLATMHAGNPARIRLPQAAWERLLGVAPADDSQRREAPTLPLRRQPATLAL